MTSCVAFQNKLSSIMEVLAKAAVLEIGKLWEDGFQLVQAELRRRDKEIEALNRQVAQLENERLTVLSQAQTVNQSRREQQSRLQPPAGDGENCTCTEKHTGLGVLERSTGSDVRTLHLKEIKGGHGCN